MMSAPDFDWSRMREPAEPAPVEPAPVVTPVAPTRALHSIDSRVAVALLGAVLMAVGSIGPWVMAFGGLLSVAGTNGDGKITLVCALIVAAATIGANAGHSLGVLAVIAAVVGLGVGVYDLSHLANATSQADGLAQTGWGLYAVVVGGAVAVVALVSARQSLGRLA